EPPTLRLRLRCVRIHHPHHQDLLVYVNSCNLVAHRNLPARKRQEACAKTSHTVTCYQPSLRDGWRDTDWFKHASQTKLLEGKKLAFFGLKQVKIGRHYLPMSK